jgi:hypothetical protein
MKRKFFAMITIVLMMATGLYSITYSNAAIGATVYHNGPWAGYTGKVIEFEAWANGLGNQPYHWIWTFYHWSGGGQTFTVEHNTSIMEDSWNMLFPDVCEYRVGVYVTDSQGGHAGSTLPVNFPNLVIKEPIDLGVDVDDLHPSYWIAGQAVYFECNVWGEPSTYTVEGGYKVEFYIHKQGYGEWKFQEKTYYEDINLYPTGFYHNYGGWIPLPNPRTYDGPFINPIGSPGTWYVRAKLTFEGQEFDNNLGNNEPPAHAFVVHPS